MLFKIYSLENTPAQLCLGHSTTTDPAIKDLIVRAYIERGTLVNIETEE